MPEKRLQKTRDAYREQSWMALTSQERIDAMLAALQADEAASLRHASAAYRISRFVQQKGK